MPITFAQPQPIPRAYGGGGGGGSGAYASLANALQDRYAADAANQSRTQLGYAQLGEERAAREQRGGMHAQDLQARFALQEQAADLELSGWMARQKFTQADQQELNRQYTAVSELQDKLDKGDISRGEFYQMVQQVAPRVNYLQAKEAHTRNQAMAEQKKALAMQNDEAAKMIAHRNKVNQMTANDRFHFEMDYGVREELEAEVDILDPTLKAMNPAEREIRVRELAQARRLGKTFLLQPDGKIEEVGGGKGASGGTEKSQSQKPFSFRAAVAEAKSELEAKGLTPDSDGFYDQLGEAVQKRQDAHAAGVAANTPEGREATRRQNIQQATTHHQTLAATVRDRADLPEDKKQSAMVVLGMMDKITKINGVPPEGSALRKQLDKLADAYRAIVGQAPEKGEAAAPQAAPPGRPPLQWGESLPRDAGNVGRSVGRAAGDTLRQMGEGIRTLPAGIADAAPLPESWRNYLFGQ